MKDGTKSSNLVPFAFNMHGTVELLADIESGSPVFWGNPLMCSMRSTIGLSLGGDDIRDAAARLDRFAPLLAQLFPDLEHCGGVIESGLVPVPAQAGRLGNKSAGLAENLFVTTDHALPVAGSIKARGGIYGVLEYAERVAMAAGHLVESSDYRLLVDQPAHDLFSSHELSVASTGNLGLSIGIMGSALGFSVTVHMSVEAKEWKKERLRQSGVTVVEHSGDYIAAGAVARELAAGNDRMFFIDDENSVAQFLGYSVAALRLKEQLSDAGIVVDEQHPLFLYLDPIRKGSNVDTD